MTRLSGQVQAVPNGSWEVRRDLYTRTEQNPLILILDDSIEVCRVLQRQLRALGRESIFGTNSSEAATHLQTIPVGLAIVDLVLQGSDIGTSFLRMLSDKHPRIRRVLMSGIVTHAELARAVRSGLSHAVLQKPWNPADLRTLVLDATFHAGQR